MNKRKKSPRKIGDKLIKISKKVKLAKLELWRSINIHNSYSNFL